MRNVRDKTPFPKKCIFCESPANSREHIYPNWIQKYLKPVDPKTTHNVALPANAGSWKMAPAGRGKMYRAGDSLTQKAKIVCSNCNNGWMSQMESEAEDFLRPIILGMTTSLDFNSLDSIRKWVTLRAIIFDQLHPKSSMVCRDVREKFRDSFDTSSWGLSFARFQGHNDRCFFHSGGQFRFVTATSDTSLDFATCMFTVGGVIFQCFHTNWTGQDRTEAEEWSHAVCQDAEDFYSAYGFSDLRTIRSINEWGDVGVAYDLDYLRLRKAFVLSLAKGLSDQLGTDFDLEAEYNSDT